MRTTFLNTLMSCAKKDDNIWLLCGDLGYSVLEPFIDAFPDRFVNVGIAEQNMVGMAAGLALTGRKVVCYSIGNFTTLRCFEQIRNDVCYHDADVKIVSVGGGLAYGAQGYTHHAIEDLGALRTLPNMTVLAPGDPVETKLATEWMLAHGAPCYLRLGKAGEPLVHAVEPVFSHGKMIEIKHGKDVLLISTGGMLPLAMEVAAALAAKHIQAGVVSAPFVKPLDEEYLAQAARYPWLVTLEEHTRFGGLGEAVASVLARLPQRSRLLPFFVPELALKGIAGSQAELLKRIGLDAAQVTAKIEATLKEPT